MKKGFHQNDIIAKKLLQDTRRFYKIPLQLYYTKYKILLARKETKHPAKQGIWFQPSVHEIKS